MIGCLLQLGVMHQSGLDPLFFLGVLSLKQGVLEMVRGVALRVVADHGFELVDVEIKRGRADSVVRLVVDKTGGIGLDELQAVSEEVSAILDVEDPLDQHYTFEVSSPGLDRPLKSEADYQRFQGKLVTLSSYEPVDGRRHWTGRLQGVEAGVIELLLEKEKGLLAKVPLDKVSHGRLEVEFGKK